MTEFEPLSKRELEIAEMLVFGATVKDVANGLFLAADTVASHKKNIYKKLSIRKETELSKWYFCRRFNISINIKPITRAIVSICMLMLLGGQVFQPNQSDMVRTARVRTSRVRRSKDN